MKLKTMIVALGLLLGICIGMVSPAQAAPVHHRHSAAWYRRHRHHSAAWYRTHRHHSAAWYRTHKKH